MDNFSYHVIHKDGNSNARVGVIHTLHGDIETPAFVPVGTQATVKSLTPEELNTLGTQLFFVNTYHAYLRPGLEVINKFGGLHTFMHWDKPLITDSGGFQIFSLAQNTSSYHVLEHDNRKPLVKITDEGVVFQSRWDGTKHEFTPEKSMQHQAALGSDIHIAFDDCTPYPVTHDKAKISMERTHAWAKRSLAAHTQGALYGVVQGSVYKDLRIESAKYISSLHFDGIAIGGVSVGENKKEMVDVLDWVTPLLPEMLPRHLLGVGEIDDIFALVEHGVDTFDCVQPTRLARNGSIYNRQGMLDITKARFEKDIGPIEKGCECYTCQHFSRAYIHHLFHVRELLAYRLATIHNLYFIQSLVRDIRESIKRNQFLDLKKKWL